MIEPVKAIKLSWEQVSFCISEELSKILGREVVCDSRWNDYCYWGTIIAGKRIPIEELYAILDDVTMFSNGSIPSTFIYRVPVIKFLVLAFSPVS